MGLALLHSRWVDKEKLQCNIWPLEGAYGGQATPPGGTSVKKPTDIVFGFPQLQQLFSYAPLKICFAVPRIGSKIICIGYAGTEVPGGGISIEEIRSGKIQDWFSCYKHSLRAVQGRVMQVFTQGFTEGYLRGGCFSIDCEVEPGQSGGPVFNEHGYVCGVISAGATNFFNKPASLVSLFFPTLMTIIKFGGSMGQNRFDVSSPLWELVSNGSMETDGSEKMVTIVPDGDSWRIGIAIHKDDSASVFDDFNGYQENRTATKETAEVFGLRRLEPEEK